MSAPNAYSDAEKKKALKRVHAAMEAGKSVNAACKEAHDADPLGASQAAINNWYRADEAKKTNGNGHPHAEPERIEEHAEEHAVTAVEERSEIDVFVNTTEMTRYADDNHALSIENDQLRARLTDALDRNAVLTTKLEALGTVVKVYV